jgi:hypothetical protein
MPGKCKVARYFTTIESFEGKSNKKAGNEEGSKFQVSGSRQQQAANPPMSPMRPIGPICPIGPISSYRSYPLSAVAAILDIAESRRGAGLAGFQFEREFS